MSPVHPRIPVEIRLQISELVYGPYLTLYGRIQCRFPTWMAALLTISSRAILISMSKKETEFFEDNRNLLSRISLFTLFAT